MRVPLVALSALFALCSCAHAAPLTVVRSINDIYTSVAFQAAEVSIDDEHLLHQCSCARRQVLQSS